MWKNITYECYLTFIILRATPSLTWGSREVTIMRALIQRVTKGKVAIEGKTVSEINSGYIILLGVKQGDSENEAQMLAEKTAYLRIMPDSENKMNLSILDTKGEILVISQFTLYADMSRGRRPSFIRAAEPETADKLYLSYVSWLKKFGVKKVVTGEFGAYMSVELINDGPVTILLDSQDFNK